MFEGLSFLASYGFYGGTVGDILSTWESVGVFSYLLPFLLIFAILIGLLNKINLFKDNKVVNIIIALSVSLMSLQFDFVPRFFSEIFPRMSIGLIIILVMIILTGILVPSNKGWMTYVFFAIGVIVLAVILVQTSGAFGDSVGYHFQQYWADYVGIIIFLVILAIVAGGASSESEAAKSPLMKLLNEG